MSEAKYYTPDISEFHIGFTYQWQSSIDEIWRDSEIKANADIKFLGEHLNQLRVKCLDHDDIVECWWEKYGIAHRTLAYSIGKHELIFNEESQKVTIDDVDYDLPNISELKRIMRQLGITKPENVKP
jgi:hypothetical protein